MSSGKDPLVSRFFRGSLRLRPAARTRVLTWDLAIALQGLSLTFFYLKHYRLHPRTWNLHLAWLKHSFILDQVTFLKSPLMWWGLLCCKSSVLLLFRMRTRKGTLCFAQCRHSLPSAASAYVPRAAMWGKYEQFFICFGPPCAVYFTSQKHKEIITPFIQFSYFLVFKGFLLFLTHLHKPQTTFLGLWCVLLSSVMLHQISYRNPATAIFFLTNWTIANLWGSGSGAITIMALSKALNLRLFKAGLSL